MEPTFQLLCMFGIVFVPFIILKMIHSLVCHIAWKRSHDIRRMMGSSDVIVKSKVVGTKRRQQNG